MVFAEFLDLVRGEGSAALVATHNERLAAQDGPRRAAARGPARVNSGAADHGTPSAGRMRRARPTPAAPAPICDDRSPASAAVAGTHRCSVRQRRQRQDRLDDEQVADIDEPRSRRKSAARSQAHLRRIKRELFRRAAACAAATRRRSTKLSDLSRRCASRSPVLRGVDEDLGGSAAGALSLDLPPGVAVAGGGATLSAPIDYAVQPAADGTGDVVMLGNADAIISPAGDPGAHRRRRSAAAARPAAACRAGDAAAPSRRRAAARRQPATPADRRRRLGQPELQLRAMPAPAARSRSAAIRAWPRSTGRWRRSSPRAGAAPTRSSAALLQRTRDRFLAYPRPLPDRRLHRRRLSRPDARDQRHHGRPLAALTRLSWG